MNDPLTVAICTYHRPEQLGALLDCVAPQLGSDVALLIVDNDAAGSSHRIAASVVDAPDANARYVIEPRPGVAHARNRAIGEARTPLLLFIDDDQLVAPNFVRALLELWRARPSAPDLAGLRVRVEPHLEVGARAWLANPSLFAGPRYPDFVRVARPDFGAGGLLLDLRRLSVIGAHEAPFDPTLGRLGGEDTDFFLRTTAAGLVYGHATSISVAERVPKHRASLAYAARMQFRAGVIDRHMNLRHGILGRVGRGRRVARALGLGHEFEVAELWLRIVAHAIGTPLAGLDGPTGLVRHLQNLAYWGGQLHGMLGGRVIADRDGARDTIAPGPAAGRESS